MQAKKAGKAQLPKLSHSDIEHHLIPGGLRVSREFTVMQHPNLKAWHVLGVGELGIPPPASGSTSQFVTSGRYGLKLIQQ